MTDPTPPTAPPVDQEPVEPIGDIDLHEEVWAEIDAAIDERVQEMALKLATVTDVSDGGGGPITVQFHMSTNPNNLGFAHVMGTRFGVGQIVVVAPLEGGDYVVLGAVTAVEGAHESVVSERDLMTDSVTARQVAPASIGTIELAPSAVDNSRLAPLAVAEGNIAANQVKEVHIDTNAVTMRQVAQDAIGSVELAPNAVDSKHLSNDAKNQFPTKQEVNDKQDKSDMNNYVKQNELGAYVKENDLAPNAKGQKDLATEEWVKSNFAKKGGGN